jgi:hypothetical protein
MNNTAAALYQILKTNLAVNDIVQGRIFRDYADQPATPYIVIVKNETAVQGGERYFTEYWQIILVDSLSNSDALETLRGLVIKLLDGFKGVENNTNVDFKNIYLTNVYDNILAENKDKAVILEIKTNCFDFSI